MITVNGQLYVLQGSNEDTGQITNIYVTHTINKTFNINYRGDNATVTTSQVVYIDVNTKTIIQRDALVWKLVTSMSSTQNVCTSASDIQKLCDLINSNKIGNVADVTVSDFNNDDVSDLDIPINTNSPSSRGGSSSDKLSEADNSVNNSNNRDSHDVVNNTLGSSTQGKDRSNLPNGMDANSDTVKAGTEKKHEYPELSKGTNIANKGIAYPIIRINDHTFFDNEIVYFSMETGFGKRYIDYKINKFPTHGFLPTMVLIIKTPNKGVLKQDIVKNGDRCSIFFTSGHKLIKSMRCDFRITNVITSEINQNVLQYDITQTIYGELYIPNLRNEKIRYNFSGTSRDGLMDAAKRLKLSFFFCDPENTNDTMVWCCCKTVEEFIHDMTTHAWKNGDAFFESWIDPHYGLSFLNINRLLGEDGLDEEIDLTIFQKAFTNHLASDGEHTDDSEEDSASSDRPAAKILTNIPEDKEDTTVYHINKWHMYNDAQAIQDFVGLNCKMQFDSINPGMDDMSKYTVDTTICINRDKCPEDGSGAFYVLLGPGKNNTYENADEYMGISETENSNNVAPEIISQPMSTGDAENIMSTDGNMLSSGNTHTFYEVAYQHNMRNLLQLQKQYMICELNGANLSLVRGEKIPVMLVDLDKATALMNAGENINPSDVLYETESGWFIIDAIEWIFDPEGGSRGTAWSTKLKLTKREWPIPGRNDQTDDQFRNSDIVVVDVGNGSSVKMAYQDAIAKYGKDKIQGSYVDRNESDTYNNNENNNTSDVQDTDVQGDLDTEDQVVKQEDKVANSDIPLTGLKSYMKDIYKAIAEETNGKVKLVAARRWAVDADGNKVDGNAFLENHGYYKCINAIGEMLYFKQNNSKHLYGEAIDIINSNGLGFNELMTDVIMKSSNILTLMYNNGISAYIEQAKDDNGVVTKHYHIGTDTTKQKEFWNSVKAVNNKSSIIPGTYIDFSSYYSKNKGSVEIVNQKVEEQIETT